MGVLARADPSDSDEFIAKAMDEEPYRRDASLVQPESGSQREWLKK